VRTLPNKQLQTHTIRPNNTKNKRNNMEKTRGRMEPTKTTTRNLKAEKQ